MDLKRNPTHSEAKVILKILKSGRVYYFEGYQHYGTKINFENGAVSIRSGDMRDVMEHGWDGFNPEILDDAAFIERLTLSEKWKYWKSFLEEGPIHSN